MRRRALFEVRVWDGREGVEMGMREMSCERIAGR